MARDAAATAAAAAAAVDAARMLLLVALAALLLLAPAAQAQTTAPQPYAMRFGAAQGEDAVRATAVDPSGNTYIVGCVRAYVDMGGWVCRSRLEMLTSYPFLPALSHPLHTRAATTAPPPSN